MFTKLLREENPTQKSEPFSLESKHLRKRCPEILLKQKRKREKEYKQSHSLIRKAKSSHIINVSNPKQFLAYSSSKVSILPNNQRAIIKIREALKDTQLSPKVLKTIINILLFHFESSKKGYISDEGYTLLDSKVIFNVEKTQYRNRFKIITIQTDKNSKNFIREKHIITIKEFPLNNGFLLQIQNHPAYYISSEGIKTPIKNDEHIATTSRELNQGLIALFKAQSNSYFLSIYRFFSALADHINTRITENLVHENIDVVGYSLLAIPQIIDPKCKELSIRVINTNGQITEVSFILEKRHHQLYCHTDKICYETAHTLNPVSRTLRITTPPSGSPNQDTVSHEPSVDWWALAYSNSDI